MNKLFALSILISFCIGCSTEIGSEKWCQEMSEKQKGDWTANEAKDYTKHCLLKIKPEE